VVHFSQNLLFFSQPEIHLSDETKDYGPSNQFRHPLAISNRYGCVAVSHTACGLIIIRVEDIIRCQKESKDTRSKKISIACVPQLRVISPIIEVLPSLVYFSHGDEFLSVDTIRNGIAFVLVFKFEELIQQVSYFFL